jgi:hypothetical protein
MRRCVENKCRNTIRPTVYNENVHKCKFHAPAKYCKLRNCRRLCLKGKHRCLQHITKKRNEWVRPLAPTTNPIMEHIRDPQSTSDISIIVDGDLTCEQIGDILRIRNIESIFMNENIFSIETHQ